MTERPVRRLLTINTGSSSLKAAVYRLDSSETLDLAAHAERIGLDSSRLLFADAGGATLFEQRGNLPSHDAALRALFTWLRRRYPGQRLVAVGHRVVHGGRRYHEPQLVTDELVRTLRELVSIDPDHLPHALAAVETARKTFPGVPQIACFDTAFHRRMPHVAQIYPLPHRYRDLGVLRYGFHGLSYEYVLAELRAIDPGAAEGRVIVAHLGNGASMAAVRGGVGVDTTMGFTPAGGLMMGTRAGDLDPGVLLYLLQTGMRPDGLSDLINQQGGLLGVSGASADMRDLLDREPTDPRAAEAIELFCYQARKFLGAMAAALGGFDTLVFTGGIGEHAWPVRSRICTGLEFLGIHLDPRRNEANGPVISRDGSTATVRVMRTNEDLMIARHVRRLIGDEGDTRVPI